VESTLTIDIAAPPDAVFALAAAVEDWPAFLPHYRWVRRHGHAAGRRTFDMAARRDFCPVRWQAVVETDPVRRVVRFEHVGGPTTGMEVEWRLSTAGGGTHVILWHRFHSRRRLIAPLYDWVVQHIFIEHIAGKTLACMKREAESRPAPVTAPAPRTMDEVRR
jgi:ribosome-associated toxin RatA of RatAB toxin-antitoxin module